MYAAGGEESFKVGAQHFSHLCKYGSFQTKREPQHESNVFKIPNNNEFVSNVLHLLATQN